MVFITKKAVLIAYLGPEPYFFPLYFITSLCKRVLNFPVNVLWKHIDITWDYLLLCIRFCCFSFLLTNHALVSLCSLENNPLFSSYLYNTTGHAALHAALCVYTECVPSMENVTHWKRDTFMLHKLSVVFCGALIHSDSCSVSCCIFLEDWCGFL